MRTAKRITTACLTAIMIFQALAPSTEVFAQELDAVMEASVSAARAAGNTVRSVQDVVATALQDADQATSDDATTTPGADAGATEGGDGSTNAGESQDSTTDGTTSGDASTEGDASQDDTTADEGAADEGQANDADADAAAQADVSYKYNTVDDLKGAIGDANVTVDADKVVGVTIGTSEDLTKLSNTDPAIYQNAAITKGGATGSGLNLCSTVTAADGVVLSFLGLGAPDAPFKGSFGSGISPIVLNRPLFNNVELSTDMTLKLTWKGANGDPIVASAIAGGDHKLVVGLTVAPAAENTTAIALTSPLLGSVSGALTLDATYAAKGGATPAVNIQSGTDNVGLLANTLVDGASLSVEQLALPSTCSGTPTIQATKDGASAGGLIGACGNGATVAINAKIDLSAFSVIGKAASGGLIGKATNLTLNIADGATVKPACNVGDAASACSGGVIGDVSFAGKFTVKPNMFDLGDGVTLGATQRAGALFGVADISNGDIEVQGGTYKSKLNPVAGGLPNGSGGSYGGLVGKVFAKSLGNDGALRALVVQKDAENRCSIEFDLVGEPSGSNRTVGYLSDAGGVAGYVGDSAVPNPQPVAVVLNGVTVACKGDASARTDTGELGGAVGVVDKGNVLDVRDFKLTSDNPIGKAQSSRAAGIAGSARNAVIKFSGITDLSGASFAENSTTGQLVYDNNNALIFAVGNGSDGDLAVEGATGWTFKRSKTVSKTDDIATYGEIIRLGKGLGGSFITLDPGTHKLTRPAPLTLTNGACTLTSVEDFAKLAITWQTNGYYSMVDGVTENNPNILQSSIITVNGKIDLAGTGLTGFTQDRADNSQVFSGTLNGSGAIDLAVGESYGMRGGAVLGEGDTSKGNGKIYRHDRLGLFAAVNGATISNVTIAGSMKFDNQSNVDAGALAGVKVGGDMSLTSATFRAGIEYESTNKDNYVHVGGVFGSMSGAGSLKIGSRETSSVINANIISETQESGVTCVGGAVGYVSSDCIPSTAGKTVDVGGLTISGSIAISNGSAKTYAGGFIGQIAQGGVNGNTGALISVKKVEITKLDFARFSLVTTGSKTSSSGGFLGYSWAGTEVTLGRDSVNASENSYAITTNGSSVKSTCATELGGLVYAASGHWIIDNYAINLAGASFIADSATTLGVLIARGSTSVSGNSFGAETSYSGLYLEDRAWWGTAYAVGGASITAPKVNTYDEWLANGVKPDSKLIDNGCNAVVSLHTRDKTLDMSGDPAKDNSYQNRISPDKFPQTNGSVRYYYNLDRALIRVRELNSPVMETPEHLVLWAARQYAPSATYSYLTGDKVLIFTNNKIGRDQGERQEINLTGYSYYPSNPNGTNAVTVQNVKIVFCYSQIRAEQKNNKSNALATQHENMHCGLIRTIGGKNFTVTGVTLSGTVGRVINDAAKGADPESASGALVLRCAYGSSGTKMADIKIDTLTLDGVQVDGAEDRQDAPLLINAITRYVNLDVKNVTTSNYAGISGVNKIAASSLFGRLGYDKSSNQVTAKFERISLPSQKGNTIFTHASLLESFGYTTTGTADYTFTKADAVAGNVTYGSEIDAQGKEYTGKQLWYYDEATYGTDEGFVKVKDESTDAERPWFSDYLPYVAKGKATENGVQYHEIKVNQRIPNFVTGCGTYGDPYVIASASEFNAAANYINNGTALDGWEVTIAKDQSTLCQRRNGGSTENEVTYVYKQANGAAKKWEKKAGNATDPNDVLSDDTMRRYLQSAYYSIEPKPNANNTIELDGSAFAGFGTSAYPFRGVIVGDVSGTAATIVIKNNTGSLRGLIPYSYGSVVRNLNIRYVDARATITYSSKNADGAPTAFFGGVIGCILGGDNIIDGVAVNNPNDGSTMYGFTVTGSSHLVPIGGYVGAIAGGGVIFRHTGDSWRGGTKEKFKSVAEGGANSQLYDNPYVGRVIDGYAFSEGGGCTADNGDANYRINKLENKGTSCVTATAASDNTTVRITPTSAQGLLVLSGIINSGAASGGVSLAYEGGTYDTKTSYKFGNARYGKVRNATYEDVGNPASAAGDFRRSITDDQSAPGFTAVGLNLPYLVNSYADAATGSLCASSGVELQLASNVPYNMTSYGRGFTGLSGRYASNACASSKGIDRDCIVPRIACINGNGAKVTVNNKTREYVDDDYCVAGVGGLFNTITFVNNPGSVQLNAGAHVKDLTFYGCNISLVYISSTGAESSISGKVPNAKDRVGIGCFAGSTANQDTMTGVFKRVCLEKSSVSGGSNAGGLIGTAGWMGRSTNSDTGLIVDAGQGYKVFPVQLYDCSYSELKVASRWCAGGFVGSILSGASGIWTTNDLTVASDSRIAIEEIDSEKADDGCMAGGFFGLAGGETYVNTGQVASSTQVATIRDVTIAVNHKAAGIGGVVGQANKQVSANRVKVTSTKEAFADSPTYFGSLRAVDNGDNSYGINAGGLAGVAKAGVSADSCTVEKIRMGVTEHAGGLVGATTGGNTLRADSSTVDSVQFDGARCGGILGNCQGQGGTNVVVTNATVRNCSFGTLNSTWNHGDGNLRNHSGGIVGAASGTIKIANILISKNDFKQPGGQGFLLGDTAQNAADFKGLYAAGVDIVLKDGTDNSSAPKPIKYFNDSAAADVNKKSYIAFGDYTGTPAAPGTGMTLYGADAADGTTAAVSPYVTTSPVSSLSVQTASGENGQTRYLFGDGVNVTGASTIKDDAEKGEAGTNVSGRYTYTNIGGIAGSGAYQNTSNYLPSSTGEFNANNDTDATKSNANPDVLVLSGNDSDTVKDYLNLVTNGGYSDALRLNAGGSHVSATVDVFQLENGVFVKQTNVTDQALDVKGRGSSLSISANSNWDNGKGRFNLLTVTFTEAGQSYRVMVPIIVKRVLEINFTATYSEGSNFNSGDYSTKYDKHVLISSGETMTGYLTWTYNKAYNQETEYGWNTHLASGGDMRPLNKRIEFGGLKGALPAGTQLTLVDAAHNNKEYHYTVPEGGSCASVALTDFEDSSGNRYTEQWLSETMGTKVTEADDGTWVKLSNEELTDGKNAKKTEAELIGIAGAKIDGDYYRLKTDADKERPFYNLTVPKKGANEQPKSESFYLVVRTPENSANVNGYTGTSVTTTSVNTHINYVLRKDEVKDSLDSHENTASTYSVATNFQHNLVDKTSADGKTSISQMAVKGTTYPLDMNVSDTITFSEQEYTSSDALYYQLDSSLVNYGKNGSAAGAHGYPTGTQGTYSFYVKVGNNYYTWAGSKWTDAGTTETPAIAAKDWSATGGDMSLVLADASGKAIDLSGIREKAKSHNNQFTITMKANLAMTEPACQAGISASQNGGTDKYTKPNYRAYLSTHAETLSTSSNSAYIDGKAGYYRMDVGSSTIALEASKKSQLGINIDDLKSADGEIALVGTYDLSKLAGAEAMISNASTVTYTLSLQKRRNDGSYAAVDNISSYITVLGSDKLANGSLSADAKNYVFTDSKGTGGTFATRDGNGLAFKHAFRVKVNTDVEGKDQTYANYRLVLTANIMTGNVVNDTPVNVSNLDGYSHSDYVTYTLARINTKGIPHKTKTN